jgi:GT2 family glycosyltransferase
MKIGILVTTFLRDEMLRLAVQSMIKHTPSNAVILIGDQGNPRDNNAMRKINDYSNPPLYYYQLPFNCGLSVARNYLVQQAYDLGCDYVVMASDSFIFTEKTDILSALPALVKYDIVGFNLLGASVYWVGDLDMIPDECYTLNFADRNEENPAYEKYGDIRVLPCSIIHNFFIACIEAVHSMTWDDKLVMAEHEDFFYRIKKAGYKVAWTPDITCEYRKTREGVHGTYRNQNWQKGMALLLQKHNLKSWIRYTNLQYGKEGCIR